MIDIETYRARIGNFTSRHRSPTFKKIREYCRTSNNYNAFNATKNIIKILFILTLLYPTCHSVPPHHPSLSSATTWTCLPAQCSTSTSIAIPAQQAPQYYRSHGKKQNVNYLARYLYGNIKRGIINIHVNIRSIFNKLSEVKRLVHQEKPHILGLSECELRKSNHDIDKLKVPGYDLLLPKSWHVHRKARVVVYIKKTLQYDRLEDLENEDIQTIWFRADLLLSSV